MTSRRSKKHSVPVAVPTVTNVGFDILGPSQRSASSQIRVPSALQSLFSLQQKLPKPIGDSRQRSSHRQANQFLQQFSTISFEDIVTNITNYSEVLNIFDNTINSSILHYLAQNQTLQNNSIEQLYLNGIPNEFFKMYNHTNLLPLNIALKYSPNFNLIKFYIENTLNSTNKSYVLSKQHIFFHELLQNTSLDLSNKIKIFKNLGSKYPEGLCVLNENKTPLLWFVQNSLFQIQRSTKSVGMNIPGQQRTSKDEKETLLQLFYEKMPRCSDDTINQNNLEAVYYVYDKESQGTRGNPTYYYTDIMMKKLNEDQRDILRKLYKDSKYSFIQHLNDIPMNGGKKRGRPAKKTTVAPKTKRS